MLSLDNIGRAGRLMTYPHRKAAGNPHRKVNPPFTCREQVHQCWPDAAMTGAIDRMTDAANASPRGTPSRTRFIGLPICPLLTFPTSIQTIAEHTPAGVSSGREHTSCTAFRDVNGQTAHRRRSVDQGALETGYHGTLNHMSNRHLYRHMTDSITRGMEGGRLHQGGLIVI